MSATDFELRLLPCLDSSEMAAERKRELDIPRHQAKELGQTAVEAAKCGHYINATGHKVDWRSLVDHAVSAKQSIRPDQDLNAGHGEKFDQTRIQVTNETTLQASRRLVEENLNPLALNFANGIYPGGGFLRGARAQEEVLCRSSALYATLVDDPMYEHHRKIDRPVSTDWAIYSPDVPVFREDDGTVLGSPWRLSFLTSAAPYAPKVGQPESSILLRQRIHRILEIAHSFGHSSLVLGAWGCGAFANDPTLTAKDFRQALETEFAGAFAEIVFAITDWSPERKFLGPFRDVFAPETS